MSWLRSCSGPGGGLCDSDCTAQAWGGRVSPAAVPGCFPQTCFLVLLSLLSTPPVTSILSLSISLLPVHGQLVASDYFFSL